MFRLLRRFGRRAALIPSPPVTRKKVLEEEKEVRETAKKERKVRKGAVL